MGLQKDFPDPYGPGPIAGAYARISRLSADFDTGQGQLRVSIYRSKEARDADYPPIRVANVDAPVAPFESATAGADIRDSLYGYLKTLGEFAGAADA